eukprot:gene16805-biopygen6343
MSVSRSSNTPPAPRLAAGSAAVAGGGGGGGGGRGIGRSSRHCVLRRWQHPPPLHEIPMGIHRAALSADDHRPAPGSTRALNFPTRLCTFPRYPNGPDDACP